MHRTQKEPSRAKQLDQGRLEVAFTPSASNGQALIERLPAHPHLGHRCVGIIIKPLLVPYSSRELQRVKAGYIPFGTENWNERFRIDRPRFAPTLNGLDPPDAGILLKAVLVIGIDSESLPLPCAAKGESHAACGQIKQVGSVNV